MKVSNDGHMVYLDFENGKVSIVLYCRFSTHRIAQIVCDLVKLRLAELEQSGYQRCIDEMKASTKRVKPGDYKVKVKRVKPGHYKVKMKRSR